jgi:hypothetical protein
VHGQHRDDEPDPVQLDVTENLKRLKLLDNLLKAKILSSLGRNLFLRQQLRISFA